MKLVEKHIIRKTHEYYEEIEKISFLSKNLYNAANYIVRQEFISTSKEKKAGLRKHANWIRYHALYKLMKTSNNPDYTALPRKISQQVLKQIDRNWKSFFEAIKDWKINPEKYKKKPSLPRYKDKQKGRNILYYTIQAINKRGLRKHVLKLSGTNIKLNIIHNNINEARIVPLKNKTYKIEIVYEKKIENKDLNPAIIAGIDVGVNNLAAVTSNHRGFTPILINGRPLKSINQYFNKQKARLQSELTTISDKRFSSNRIENMTVKRNNKIEDYIHKSTKFIIDILVEYSVGTLVIGLNPEFKQGVNIGSRNNQNFVNIPHSKFVKVLEYKAQLVGMIVIIREEAHTSKCSFIDMEEVGHHETYVGRRIKRGMFKSKDGILINADCNGSGNIIRKEFLKAFVDGIEGVVVRPIKVTIPFSGKPEIRNSNNYKQVA